MAFADQVQEAFLSAKKLVTEFDLKQWTKNIGGSSAEAVEAAVYFVLSFGLGFLFKKYFKPLLVCLVVTLFVIKGMEYLKFLIIDWNAIKLFFGITPNADINVMINHAFDWIKAHLLLFIASIVGFLIGYKLG